MLGVLKWLKREIIELLPAVVFFFVAFNLIVLTDTLTTEEYGVRVFSFLAATVGAIVVAKAVLLANLLPFVGRYGGKPLIYPSLWRTLLYIHCSVDCPVFRTPDPFSFQVWGLRLRRSPLAGRDRLAALLGDSDLAHSAFLHLRSQSGTH